MALNYEPIVQSCTRAVRPLTKLQCDVTVENSNGGDSAATIELFFVTELKFSFSPNFKLFSFQQ